jgi:hypothetical protein
LFDPSANVKLQAQGFRDGEKQAQEKRDEGLKRMVDNARQRNAQRQAFTDVRDPLQFIQNYSSDYNERKGQLWRNVDSAKENYEARTRDNAPVGTREAAFISYQEALKKELEHRKIVEPNSTLSDVVKRSNYSDILNTDWSLGGGYKEFFDRYHEEKIMMKSPEGVDVPVQSKEEAGRHLFRLRNQEIVGPMKQRGLMTEDGQFVSKIGDQPISKEKIYELIAETTPGSKYVYKSGDKFSRFQEIWSNKFGGNFTKGAMGLFGNSSAKFTLSSSGSFSDLGDTSFAGEQGGAFEVQRARQDAAPGAEPRAEPEVLGRYNILDPNEKLMMAIQQSARNNFKGAEGPTGFKSIYEGMSLSARESFKRKYKDQIEQKVPPSIVKQLNHYISKVDKTDLYGVAKGDLVPNYLKKKIENRSSLTRGERDELREYKRRESEAQRIVQEKRRASGISRAAGYLIDQHSVDEPLARFISSSPGYQSFRQLSNADKLIKEVQAADISVVSRKIGGSRISSEKDRRKKLESLQRQRTAYYNNFRASVERDPSSSKNIIFDSVHPRGFRANPDIAQISNNVIRRPVISELSDAEKKAALRLNIDVDDELIRTDSNGVPIYKEQSRNGVRRFEGTGPFDIITKTNKLEGVHETFDLDVVQKAAANAAREIRAKKDIETEKIESNIEFDPAYDTNNDGKLTGDELKRKRTMEEIAKRNQASSVKPSAKGFAPPKKSAPFRPNVKPKNFSAKASVHQAYSEIKQSVLANYKKPVTPDQVGIANLRTGTGRHEKRVVNSQEKMFNYGGLDFVAPPKNSGAARKYASDVESDFGIDPYDKNIKYAAEGFIPDRGQVAKAEKNPIPGINKLNIGIIGLAKVLNTKMFQTKEVETNKHESDSSELTKDSGSTSSFERSSETASIIKGISSIGPAVGLSVSAALISGLTKMKADQKIESRLNNELGFAPSENNDAAKEAVFDFGADFDKLHDGFRTINKAPVGRGIEAVVTGLSSLLSQFSVDSDSTHPNTESEAINAPKVIQDTVTSSSVSELMEKVAKQFLTKQSDRFNNKEDNKPTGEIMEATLSPLVEIWKKVSTSIKESMVEKEKKSKIEDERKSKERGDLRKQSSKLESMNQETSNSSTEDIDGSDSSEIAKAFKPFDSSLQKLIALTKACCNDKSLLNLIKESNTQLDSIEPPDLDSALKKMIDFDKSGGSVDESMPGFSTGIIEAFRKGVKLLTPTGGAKAGIEAARAIEFVEPKMPKIESVINSIAGVATTLGILDSSENKELSEQLSSGSSIDSSQNMVKENYKESQNTNRSKETSEALDIKRFFDGEAMNKNETGEPEPVREALEQPEVSSENDSLITGLISALGDFINKLAEVSIEPEDPSIVANVESVPQVDIKPDIDVDREDFQKSTDSAREIADQYSVDQQVKSTEPVDNQLMDSQTLSPNQPTIENPGLVNNLFDGKTQELDSQSSGLDLITQMPEGVEELLTIKPPVETPDLSLDPSQLNLSIDRLQEVLRSAGEIQILPPDSESLRLSMPENSEESMTLKMPTDQERIISVDVKAFNEAIVALNEAVAGASNITQTIETKIDTSGTINVSADSAALDSAIRPALSSFQQNIMDNTGTLMSSKIAQAMNAIIQLIGRSS